MAQSVRAELTSNCTWYSKITPTGTRETKIKDDCKQPTCPASENYSGAHKRINAAATARPRKWARKIQGSCSQKTFRSGVP
ncbi:hypothetical protein CCM_07327 [Cordyceps militaris CM01]|uniref:Uncharacterized protein n=1 Tax=Cordyceps militaris (strain CM01) TaxID=983644 RepID=G3JPM6_CORMM|nr:uncharacterized protein CCM_07327 [Cordyceps militaris CM01]EGX89075.1 hypothetical protein CCM_07327 [Cordyceps militaris CM01]